VTAVSATHGGPVPDVGTFTVPAADDHRHRSGFWAAAFAFLIVMAVATLPSPLYGLYRTRDYLSALTIAVVFVIFAGSTIAMLRWDSAIAARIGRRGVMLGAVATMMVAMGVLAAWKDLPGLLIGRLVTGVAVGLATGGLPASRVLALGTASMLTGLVLLVVSVRLSIPDLALFLIAGALIGAGSGAVFKGTTGIVLEASPPESRVAMTSDLLIALYVGLSVPVVGAGVALDLGASAPNTVLVFAILVGLGVAVTGWALLGRRGSQVHP
jgi:hypothetical protein